MNFPILSIIITYWKNIDTLPRLLESILCQTLKSVEVIIIDDYSCDDVEQLISVWISKGLNIILVKQEKRTFRLQCRLDGIRYAKGRMLIFVDADDVLWGTEALEHNVELLLCKHADIVHFRTVVIDEKGKFLCHAPLADPFGTTLRGRKEIFEYYCQSNIWGTSSLWNKIFSYNVCKKILPYVFDINFKNFSDDWWLFLNLIFETDCYIGSESIGYGYYIIDKRHTIYPDRAISRFHLYNAAKNLLLKKSIPEYLIKIYLKKIENILCCDVGHLCRAINHLSEKEKQKHLFSLQKKENYNDIVETLIAAGSINAERLIAIYNIYR